MLTRSRPGWAMLGSAAMLEAAFHARREPCKSIAAGSILAAATPLATFPGAARAEDDLSAGLYPAPRDDAYAAATRA